MPLALIPRESDEPLLERMERLGRRLRRVAFVRGGSRLVAVGVAAVVLLCFIDLRVNLPDFVRALALAGLVVGGLLYFLLKVRRPARGSGDPVRMALRVESHHPGLNDALASAVQFLQMPTEDKRSSPQLRKEAIRHATSEADQYDLDAAVDSRGTGRWLLAGFAVVCAALVLRAAHRDEADTALKRLVFPFSGTPWPTKTRIEIVQPNPMPTRLARGEPLELVVAIRGVIPERAALTVWIDGGNSFSQEYVLPPDEKETTLTMRVESSRLPRGFRFQVVANDAKSPVYGVAVQPPPALVPLDGRPSPQVRLEFAKYTDLPALDLPDGSTLIEAVAGTRVTIRAATDRAVVSARIGYRPDQPKLIVTAPLSALGSDNCFVAAGNHLLAREAWADVPAEISGAGKELSVSFVPRLPGTYHFIFEDDTGLAGARLFECRVTPDPAPVVTLDRPSAGRDPLAVLPDAEITLGIAATDKIFALRSVFLEYRTSRNEPWRTVPLGDVEQLQAALPALARLVPVPLAVPDLSPAPLRPQNWGIEQRIALSRFVHAEGRPLKEGDILLLQGAATDFDDVTGFKAPGRSQEVELQIVAKAHLEAAIQQAQADLRGELLKLHAQQREARLKVLEVLARLRNGGKLSPEDQERLLQAEQTQQQIRARVNAPEDGLRAELERLQQSIRTNRLPRTPTAERIDDMAREIERLAAEELDPIEPLIALGRREHDQAQAAKNALSRAERHQREVEQTLRALLERLELWSGPAEIRGEARGLQGELRRAAEQNKQMSSTIPPGEKREKLTPEQRADLERAAVRQERLAERGRQLTEKLNRLADAREEGAEEQTQIADAMERDAKEQDAAAAKAKPGSDEARAMKRAAGERRAEAERAREAAEAANREAAALREAAKAGDLEQLKDLLKKAGGNLRENELGTALSQQQAAADKLQKMIEALEEKPAEDGERLAKKTKQAGERLDDLIEQQERLQKKVEEASKIADPEQRREELQKLAREQEKLEQLARDLAERLNRARADDAADELRRAARQMDEAREQLEQGQMPNEAQNEALERLDDAADELDRAREQQEEQLLREKLAQVADIVKALRDRQQTAIEESDRIHATAKQARGWSRPLLSSLIGLRDQQQGLGKETRALVEKRFADLKVFARMLQQAADAMDDAAKRMDERREDVLDQIEVRGPYQVDLEAKLQGGTLAQQALALKRLDQLLEAIKPDEKMMQAARQQQLQRQPMGGNPPQQNQPMGDNIPPLAQLKALRSLQADLLERTTAFAKLHPDRSKLDDEAAKELESLEKAQREIAELVQDLAAAAAGDEP